MQKPSSEDGRLILLNATITLPSGQKTHFESSTSLQSIPEAIELLGFRLQAMLRSLPDDVKSWPKMQADYGYYRVDTYSSGDFGSEEKASSDE